MSALLFLRDQYERYLGVRKGRRRFLYPIVVRVCLLAPPSLGYGS